MLIDRMKWFLGAPIVALAAASLSPDAGREAGRKFQRVLDEQLRSGEVLTFTQREVNSFFAYEPPPEMPEGISNVRVQILEDRGLIDADVDLEKVQAAGGSEPSFLLWLLLRGERHVRASCRFTSADGVGVVDVESVSIDRTVLQGPLLDWVLAQYVAPRVPEFQPGEPMLLPKNLKEVRLEKGRAVVQGF